MAQHPIGDHALLADGRTAALVDPTGNVAWLCWPRVDSAPCLLGILDDAAGGTFRVAPADPAATVVERRYEPGTLVLRTVWRTPTGELTTYDALACDGEPRLVRRLRARGSVAVQARVALAPGAGSERPRMTVQGSTLRVRGGGIDVTVHAPTEWIAYNGVAECGVEVSDSMTAFVLCDTAVESVAPTLDGTRDWFARRVPGAGTIAPNEVASAVLGESGAGELLRLGAAVLAGLRQRGGGIVAAPTTSLPQWPGGSRTWDYRYSWLRDTALAGVAMLRCGLVDDAVGLGGFLGSLLTEMPPPVLRRVDGSASPPERTVDTLRGHGDARPVRLGNAASEQPQLDVAGEILELATALAGLGVLPTELASAVPRLADWTAHHWIEPDHGIWEIRGPARSYTHSRVMAWAGLTDAAALAERRTVDGDAAGWREAADAVMSDVLARGSPLTLHDAGGGPDAALAQAVLTGFLATDDTVATATLDSILEALDSGGLVERHLPAEDTLDEPCGPFVFPTFWVAEALRRCGRDGTRHYAAATAVRGALGLFGEVADPRTRTPLGNYPQVQSHAAFILASTEPPPRG